MAKNVNVRNKAYNKEQLDKVVDRRFSFFGSAADTEDEITVEEFFQLYEELYYEIPLNGPNNSHEYLARRSGELINYETDTTDIQPLLDEIAALRQQILAVQEDNIELRNQQALG